MIWDLGKFWAIWVSCLDQYRTLKQIQRIWKYKGNALYQRGERLPIWREMVEMGALEERGVVKRRGVSGRLLYGKMGWIRDYLDVTAKQLKYTQGNPLLFDVCECFPNKARLVKFLDERRKTFFSLPTVKTLFGNKENLRDYGNLAIFCPITTILLSSLISLIREEGVTERETLLLLLQPVIFNPNFLINFPGYFKAVMSELRPDQIPRRLISREALFRLWKRYVRDISTQVKL